ncbi:MAG: hypothetical protein ACR2KM_04195 [Gemmatimonadaceae bacterium]
MSDSPNARREMDPMLSMLSSAVMSAKQACDAAAMALRLYHESRAGASQPDAAPELPKTFMAKIERAAQAGSPSPEAQTTQPTLEPQT